MSPIRTAVGRRSAALVCVLALSLASCGTIADIAGDIATEAENLQGGSDGSAATGTDGGDGNAPDGGTGTAGGDTPARTDANDFGGVGANGRALLRGDRADLVIEVDVQAGAPAPSQGALDHLAATLRAVVDKPGGVQFAGGNTFPSDRTQWTSGDLREAAKANRTAFSNDDTVAIYLLYVRGSFYSGGEQTSAIGVTYNASEVGIFAEKWEGFGALLGSTTAVERSVLIHELGHLFGLVNLTYTSEIAHEDADHRGHSNSKGSVMYYAIETTLIQQVFSGAPPDAFDDADLADLEGLKTGRY